MEGSCQYFTVPACPVVNAVQELFFNTTPVNPLDPDLSICRYMLVADVLHVVCVVVPVRDGRFVAPRHMFFVKIIF